MATTITRSSLTDGVTLWDAARVNSAIYDPIDSVLSGNLVIGGTISSQTVGNHAFSAGGTGANSITIRNTTAGTGNSSQFVAGNDGSGTAGRMIMFSSTYITAGQFIQDSLWVGCERAGGLVLAASHASASVHVYTSGVRRGQVLATGEWAIGGTAAAIQAGILVTASPSNTGAATNVGVKIASAISAPQDQQTYGVSVEVPITESGAGTHLWVRGLNIDASMVGGGAATTNAAQLYINSALGAGIATNAYAIYVAAGRSYFGEPIVCADGTVSAPALSFLSETGLGIYRAGASDLRICDTGIDSVRIAQVPFVYLGVNGGAWGTGAIAGSQVNIGRNTSGGGAAGSLSMIMRGGSQRYLWVDNSGNLLIHTAAPTEDNTTVSDTAGTVVGTQTSERARKTAIQPFEDYAGALALIEQLPLRRFQYTDDEMGDRHVGIIADEAPAFVRLPREPGGLGRVFDPINAFGYSAAAIKQLAARVAALEALCGR